MQRVKAVGYYQGRPITEADSLLDVQIKVADPTGRDVLVKVAAVAVNPIDTKTRSSQVEKLAQPKIIGYDAVGTVVAVGESVTSTAIGDRVFYAGAANRTGSDAELQLVDERLLGRAPEKWADADIAGLPLTTLTAWEALFEKAAFKAEANGNHGTILIVNGAGGVGSIAIQLAKWAGLTVITTAGKPATKAWVAKLGADVILDYHQDLLAALHAQGYSEVPATFLFQSTAQYLPLAAQITQPLGCIVALVTNTKPLPMELLKAKSLDFKWEFMFTKANYQLAEMASQGIILTRVAQLVDQGRLQSTTTHIQKGINAETLKAAHATVEANQMLGKYVLTAPFNGVI